MQRVARRLLTVVAVTAILATAVGTVPSQPHASADTGVVQGFAIGYPNNNPAEYARLVRMGTNTLYIDVYWEADSPNADSVHPYSSTPTDQALGAEIDSAQRAGLRVALMPKVYCNGCQQGWRGFLKPDDPDAFMNSYGGMVKQLAALGQQHGVWLMFLGSEMNNLQEYSDDWRQLADGVRRVGFNGIITYQPNWDSTGGVGFWDALDVVAVSAYFPLTSTPRPGIDELKAAWHSSNVQNPDWRGQDWFGKLQHLAQSTGKKVLIGEVGYRSSETATETPWDEATQETPDQITQANAYQALLETFTGQPWWMGVIWWQWRNTDAASDNSDMSPKAKQAEELLTKWWAEGWRPTADSKTPDLGNGSAPAHGAVLAAHAPSAAPRPGTTAGASTTAGATTTQQTVGNLGTVDPRHLANGDEGPATLAAPKSASGAHHDSGSRDVLLGVALLGLLGMGGALLNLARIRMRTPRPLV